MGGLKKSGDSSLRPRHILNLKYLGILRPLRMPLIMRLGDWRRVGALEAHVVQGVQYCVNKARAITSTMVEALYHAVVLMLILML